MVTHRISNQEKTSALNSKSLFLISEPQNQYQTAWKSKAINAESVGDAVEIQFRKKNFQEDLGVLEDINDNYLNADNLTIVYDNVNDKIQLCWDGVKFSEFDSSQFVTESIIKDAYMRNGKLVIEFKTAEGGTKEVEIDLASLIDVYTAGNGLCCNDKTFRINEDIVSTVGHTHQVSNITDFPENVSYFTNDSDYSTRTELSDAVSALESADMSVLISAESYTDAEIGKLHTHANLSVLSTITDKNISQWTNDSGYLTAHLTYGEISDGINLSAYELKNNLKSAAYQDKKYFAISSHNHDGRYYTETEVDQKISGFVDKSKFGTAAYTQSSDYLAEDDFSMSYTAGEDTLWLSVGSSVLSAKITTSGGEGGVTYEYVKGALSADGYCVTFIDWDD